MKINKILRSEEIHFGDSLNLMQCETEFTQDQNEQNIENSENMEKLEILVWVDGSFCDVMSHLGCQPQLNIINQAFLLCLAMTAIQDGQQHVEVED